MTPGQSLHILVRDNGAVIVRVCDSEREIQGREHYFTTSAQALAFIVNELPAMTPGGAAPPSAAKAKAKWP